MANKEIIEDEFIINLTIDGTCYEDIDVKVTNPNKTIREQIESIVNVFDLPKTDSCGTPIQYLLGLVLDDYDEPTILEYEDEDGLEQSMVDYGIKPGDSLRLLTVPAYACPVPTQMEQEFDDNDFVINLTIDGTGYEDIEVRVADPNKTIRDQINSIIRVFELPKKDNGGNCLQYLLGQVIEDEDEPKIFDFEDEDGREQCLLDYNVQPGDCLHLLSVPIAGYACPVPVKMEKEWAQYYLRSN